MYLQTVLHSAVQHADLLGGAICSLTILMMSSGVLSASPFRACARTRTQWIRSIVQWCFSGQRGDCWQACIAETEMQPGAAASHTFRMKPAVQSRARHQLGIREHLKIVSKQVKSSSCARHGMGPHPACRRA